MIKKLVEIFTKYRFLLKNLVSRDFKVKYRRSFLGVLWSVINPLLMMLIVTAVFSRMFQSDIPNFPVYYLTGLLIFNFFSEATSFSTGAILQSGSLIKKVYIPKMIFPIEKVIFSFINTILFLPGMLIIMLATKTPFSFKLFLIPIPLFYLFVFTLGVALFLSSVTVFFRDMNHLWGVITTALMYLTPLFYPVTMLPDTLQILIKFNPLYWYVRYMRELVLAGTIPSLRDNLICIIFAVISLIFGNIIFNKLEEKFILHI